MVIVKTLMSTFFTLFSSALTQIIFHQAIWLGILKISWNIHSILHHHIRSFNKNFDSVIKWLTLMRVGFLGVHFEVMGGFIFPITVNSLLWIDCNCKNGNKITIFRHEVIINFFWCCFVSLVKFSYWSKFHGNNITGSGVVVISFCKGLSRNLEIGSTPVWVLPNIWRLERVRNTKLGMELSNKMLLYVVECQGYNFYHFWVIKQKPTGGGWIKL